MPDLCVNSVKVHPGAVNDFKPSGWATSESDEDLVNAGAGVSGLGVILDPSVSRQRITDNSVLGGYSLGTSGAIPDPVPDGS